MPGSSLSIDVVVVTYGKWELTESCLAHLERQTAAHTLIVSDNGSTDGTPERIRESFPRARLVVSERNLPYPVACNRGAAAGDGDVVVMMNNDVDCPPEFIERLVAPLEADPGLGMVAPLLLQPGEEAIDSVGLMCDVTLAGYPRYAGRPPEEADAATPTVAGPAGAAAAFRRSAWDAAGGLDESFVAYNEDFDLALRLRIAGWGSAVALDARAVHVGGATFGKRSEFQRRNGGFGRGYLLRRYGVLRTRAGARALLTEALVVAADTAINRDLAALRGRVAGWRAARSKPRLPMPPADAIERQIGLRDSLRLRRGVYFGAPRARPTLRAR